MANTDDKSSIEVVNYLSFNQENTCFAIGTGNGFKIFNTYPFKKLFEREIGPVGIVEMLYRSNLLIIVKASKKSPYLDEKLVIFDDSSNKSVGDLTFKSPVRAVKISKQLYTS